MTETAAAPIPVLGLLGLPDLAAELTTVTAGRLRVVSDPDPQAASKQVQTAARRHGWFPTLALNTAAVEDLLPALRFHTNVTVLGTADRSLTAESPGRGCYQLPGSVADLVKQVDLDPAVLGIPDDLSLDAHGHLTHDTTAGAHATHDAEAQNTAAGARADVGTATGWPVATTPTAEPVSVQRDAGRSGNRSSTARLDDASEVFGAAAALRQQMRGGAERAGVGEVIFVLSGSGGVGKTTLALGLAGRAADRGKNVAVIDANLGQPDIATYLGIADAGLPTITFAVLTRPAELTRAIINPDQLNAARNARSSRSQPLRFALVQGPARGDGRRITMHTINDLVRRARELADLVVVDTQIVEADDPRNMVDALLLPQLGRGGWALAATSESKAGVANMLDLLREVTDRGINPARLLTVLSRFDRDSDLGADRLHAALEEASVPVGTAWSDPTIKVAMNHSEPVSDHPVLAPVFDTVLSRVFADLPAPVKADTETTRRRPRLLRRRTGEAPTHRSARHREGGR